MLHDPSKLHIWNNQPIHPSSNPPQLPCSAHPSILRFTRPLAHLPTQALTQLSTIIPARAPVLFTEPDIISHAHCWLFQSAESRLCLQKLFLRTAIHPQAGQHGGLGYKNMAPWSWNANESLMARSLTSLCSDTAQQWPLWLLWLMQPCWRQSFKHDASDRNDVMFQIFFYFEGNLKSVHVFRKKRTSKVFWQRVLMLKTGTSASIVFDQFNCHSEQFHIYEKSSPHSPRYNVFRSKVTLWKAGSAKCGDDESIELTLIKLITIPTDFWKCVQTIWFPTDVFSLFSM